MNKTASPKLGIVLPGLVLTGVCYGLARFAYGLFLPGMRDTVGMTPTIAGVVGSGSYLGYCLAIILSMLLVERLGARRVALLAGLVASLGMAMIAVSPSPWVLAFAVLFAGMSTGLASPPMADAVARTISPRGQARANTLISSGTSVGIAFSGAIALVARDHWRSAYLLFTVLAVATTLWLARTMPRVHGRNRSSTAPSKTPGHGLYRRDALPLIYAATGMGFASTACWVFAGEVVVEVGGLSKGSVSLVWVAMGAAGLLGGAAGDLIRHLGVTVVHRFFLVMLAAATLGLALFPASLAMVLISAALLGVAYMMLAGTYLVWGVNVYADRPAVGLGLPFLMIAVGQVIGAPVAGALMGSTSSLFTFAVFACMALVTMAATYRPGPERELQTA
ncbi:YbfB/YjiJ family MFS transporter [Halomonas shantousis]